MLVQVIKRHKIASLRSHATSIKRNNSFIGSVISERHFSTKSGGKQMFKESLPAWLSSEPGQVDVLRAESNNIMFNLATEEYMFDHLPLVNPLLFLWRNTKTIIIGKH